MGVLIRIVLFAVGLVGLGLTGANGAEQLGVDVGSHLSKMGAFGGVATSAVDLFGGGLAHVGNMIGGLAGAPKEGAEPSMLVKWAPEAIAALVSGMMLMGSARR